MGIESLHTKSIAAFSEALKAAAAVHCNDWPQDDGALNEAEGMRQTLRLASAGILCFLETNPDYPELVKQQTLTRQIQLPSADAVYHYCRLNGRNTYRITGDRGSAHILQISVWNGSCSNLIDYRMIDMADSDSNDFLRPGSKLDLILSAEEQQGNWLRLPPGDCEIYVRQYYGDWESENPAMLTIERVGAVYPPPPPDPARIENGMRMVCDWLKTQSAYFEKSIKFHLAADPTVLPILPIPEAFADNVYLNGHFRCQPDEAVILEADLPEAVYWGFQLANLQWEPMEYHQRQSSLNFSQASFDPDGKLRIIISHKDPGVANWLDTSGRTLGLISGRIYKATAECSEPRLRTVPFAELERHLPAGLTKVSSEARQEIIKRRQSSAFRRLCSDQ